jgi:hypothetical protein
LLALATEIALYPASLAAPGKNFPAALAAVGANF